MNKLSVFVLFFVALVSAYSGGGSDCTLGIRKFLSPDYPNVARLAQVSGDVRLLAKLTEDGRVEAADALSGPAILASYARKNLLTWQFTHRPEGQEIQVVYHYRLREPGVYGPVVPLVSLESPSEIMIVSNLPLPSGHPE